jgi:hypothetical protein
MADMFIRDLRLIESLPRHAYPPRIGSRAGNVGLVFPGGRQIGFAGIGVLDGWRDVGVVIADDFAVRPEVMLKPFDA